MAKKNLNPLNVTTGSQVLLPLRGDGTAHRDGDDAVWEVIGFQLDGAIATLHLVGADSSRAAGAVTACLRPAN